jgi:hypothetical protein
MAVSARADICNSRVTNIDPYLKGFLRVYSLTIEDDQRQQTSSSTIRLTALFYMGFNGL